MLLDIFYGDMQYQDCCVFTAQPQLQVKSEWMNKLTGDVLQTGVGQFIAGRKVQVLQFQQSGQNRESSIYQTEQ